MEIFWINISKLKYEDFLNTLTKDLKKGIKNIVFTPNPEILLNTLEDREFKNIIQKANYLTPDWIWLYVWAQILENKKNIFLEIFLLPYYFFNLFFRKKFLYKKYWDRICGSDLTFDLIEFSRKNNIKIAIIDPYFPQDLAKCESQKNFRENLGKKFPKLDFQYFIYKKEDSEKIIKKIKESNVSILFSTLWMKAQEKNVVELMWRCENIKLWLWVWSSFDYFIWFQKRAPKIYRKIWFEWFYRLISWPKKIQRIKRLYKAIMVFILKILTNK